MVIISTSIITYTYKDIIFIDNVFQNPLER